MTSLSAKKQKILESLQDSDGDESDYSPKPTTKRTKAKQAHKHSHDSSPASTAPSDSEPSSKKRKITLPEGTDDIPSYSDIICTTHKLQNCDVEIPDNEIQGITYKKFSKFAR